MLSVNPMMPSASGSSGPLPTEPAGGEGDDAYCAVPASRVGSVRLGSKPPPGRVVPARLAPSGLRGFGKPYRAFLLSDTMIRLVASSSICRSARSIRFWTDSCFSLRVRAFPPSLLRSLSQVSRSSRLRGSVAIQRCLLPFHLAGHGRRLQGPLCVPSRGGVSAGGEGE